MATAGELRALHYVVPDDIGDDDQVLGPEQYSHGPRPPAERERNSHGQLVWVEKARFHVHVDKSSDPAPPTAGGLRKLGYMGFDPNLPDDAVFGRDFMEYASGGPASPGTYRYVDDIPPTPYPYPKPEPAAAEEPKAESEPEQKPGAAAEKRRRPRQRHEEMQAIVEANRRRT